MTLISFLAAELGAELESIFMCRSTNFSSKDMAQMKSNLLIKKALSKMNWFNFRRSGLDCKRLFFCSRVTVVYNGLPANTVILSNFD